MKRFLFIILIVIAAISSANAQTVVASGNCGTQGDNLTWVLSSDSVLTISGKGNIENTKTFRSDNSQPFFAYKDYVKTLIIKDSIVNIKDYAFEGFGSLKFVIIGNSVETIGCSVFHKCNNLISVKIGSNIKTICDNVFTSFYFTNLISIDVDNKNNIYSSENGILFNKTRTILIKFPLGKNKTDTVYNIPRSVKTIRRGAFWNCYNLKTIIIPNSVKTIEDDAFWNCISLKSIKIPNSIKTIKYSAFRNSGLTSVIIPNRVKILESTFLDCKDLTSVTIPKSVKFIKQRTFSGCIGLTSIIIPYNVKIIHYYAFLGCDNLMSITLGKKLEKIEIAAFAECIRLNSITCYASKPPILSNGTFSRVNANTCTVYVPTESVALYQKAEVWKNFKIEVIK